MNGSTAKLIRRIAQKRGKANPRYVRSLKREWYSLDEGDRELKRIQYQLELEDFEQEISEEFYAKIKTKDVKISDCLSQISRLRAKNKKCRQKVNKIQDGLESADLGVRLRYLFTGTLQLNQLDPAHDSA